MDLPSFQTFSEPVLISILMAAATAAPSASLTGPRQSAAQVRQLSSLWVLRRLAAALFRTKAARYCRNILSKKAAKTMGRLSNCALTPASAALPDRRMGVHLGNDNRAAILQCAVHTCSCDGCASLKEALHMLQSSRLHRCIKYPESHKT